MHATLDPVRLLREIRAAQQRLVEIADRPMPAMTAPSAAPTLEQFLSGLRTAWQEGEVRPTARAETEGQALAATGRSVCGVSVQLQGWFEAEPWRTSRELFERLQAEHPGGYPDGQLRTLQRRMKVWRRRWRTRWFSGRRNAADMRRLVRQRSAVLRQRKQAREPMEALR